MKYYPSAKSDHDVKRATILTRAEFLLVMKVAALTRQATRNQLMLAITHGTGTRCTEMAQITIADVMHTTGVLRDEVTLRASVTKGNKARVVPFNNKLLREKLNAYLAYRSEHRIGTDLYGGTHRGLIPALALLYSDRRTPFQLSQKVRRARKRGGGEVLGGGHAGTNDEAAIRRLRPHERVEPQRTALVLGQDHGGHWRRYRGRGEAVGPLRHRGHQAILGRERKGYPLADGTYI